MTKREEMEKKSIQIILSKGDEGILQSELWKELNASSREGSRLALDLENKKRIRRQRELSNGRWTYRVFVNIRQIEIDSIIDVPCVSCTEISKCEPGGKVTPNTCFKLTQWLLSSFSNEKS